MGALSISVEDQKNWWFPWFLRLSLGRLGAIRRSKKYPHLSVVTCDLLGGFCEVYHVVWVDPIFTNLSYFLRVRHIMNFPRQFEFFQVHFIMFEIHNLRPQPLECWVRESWESNEKCIQMSSRMNAISIEGFLGLKEPRSTSEFQYLYFLGCGLSVDLISCRETKEFPRTKTIKSVQPIIKSGVFSLQLQSGYGAT